MQAAATFVMMEFEMDVRDVSSLKSADLKVVR